MDQIHRQFIGLFESFQPRFESRWGLILSQYAKRKSRYCRSGSLNITQSEIIRIFIAKKAKKYYQTHSGIQLPVSCSNFWPKKKCLKTFFFQIYSGLKLFQKSNFRNILTMIAELGVENCWIFDKNTSRFSNSATSLWLQKYSYKRSVTCLEFQQFYRKFDSYNIFCNYG